MKIKSGVELIAAERRRQITVEQWSHGHDDEHDEGEMARAAAVYALPANVRDWSISPYQNYRTSIWPWDDEWWKPSPKDRVRELVKAGALIAAEIDRLNRRRTATRKTKGRA